MRPDTTTPSQNSGAKPKRSPRRTDLNKMQGAWIISDESRMAMEGCAIFRDLDRQQLMAVAALVEEQVFEADEVLISEGDSANWVYVVTEGRAVAQLQMDHGWLSLGLLGPGDIAGWSALIDQKFYPASVKALTQMRTARIDASGLSLLLSLEPQIGYPVQKRLSTIFCNQYESALKALKTAG